MKNVLKSTAAVIALTAVFAAPASAMISTDDLRRDVHSALNADSNVFVNINNGVVTLSGYYADGADQNAALEVARKAEGVTGVIDLATQTN